MAKSVEPFTYFDFFAARNASSWCVLNVFINESDDFLSFFERSPSRSHVGRHVSAVFCLGFDGDYLPDGKQTCD